MMKTMLPDALRCQRSRAMHRFAPPLSDEARGMIVEVLHDDIDQTEELLGRDLSFWKSSHTTAAQT